MFDYGLAGILYSSLHFVLLSCVRYWLYRDSLRIPLKWIQLLVLTIMLVSSGFWLLTGGIPGVSFNFYRAILSALMFLLSCYVIKEPLSKHAFAYAFIFAFVSTMETTALYAQTRLAPNQSAWIYITVIGLMTAVFFYPAVYSLKRMIIRLSEQKNNKVWSCLCLCCFSFLIMNLILAPPNPNNLRLIYPLSRYLTLLAMVFMYMASVQIMDTMRITANANAHLQLMERRVALQQSYYEQLTSQMEDIRRMRHDLRHHRSALAALVQKGDTAALSKYLETIPEIDEIIPLTGCLAVDSILLFYTNAAKALGVNMEMDLALGKPPLLSDPELCVIFGNLLENAIDAQKYIKEENRYIRISARSDEGGFILAVDNHFDGTLLKENNRYLSRKE